MPKVSTGAEYLVESLLEGQVRLWSMNYLVNKLATGDSDPLARER